LEFRRVLFRSCLLCDFPAHAFHFIQHGAVLHLGHPVFDITLALAHADLDRLLAHRLVRKDTDPGLAATLDVACHGTTTGLDLACSESTARYRLETVFTETHGIAALRKAAIATFLLLAKLGTFGLQHDYQPAVVLASADLLSATASLSKTSPLKIHTLTPRMP